LLLLQKKPTSNILYNYKIKKKKKKPYGKYQGDTAIFGMKISAKVVVHSDTTVVDVDLHITGTATAMIDCLSEK
jgi:hypothetical protein